jgi:uncharacterized protein (DUF736 family)
MQLTIGKFVKDGPDFDGRLAMLTFQENAMILPTRGRRGNSAPDYRVYANGVQIGEARRASDKRGRLCLSVLLDDPVFLQPIVCKLVEDGFLSYRLVWSR